VFQNIKNVKVAREGVSAPTTVKASVAPKTSASNPFAK